MVLQDFNFSIYHDLSINAPLHQIYEAVTEPNHLVNWWPLKCEGRPQMNEQYNFFFSPKYDWYGKVEKVENGKSFYIKMTHADPDWDNTVFGYEFVQKESSVLVQFSHIGWPKCNAHFRRSSFCWAMLLNGMKNYVEKGIIVPFEERE